MARTLSLTNRPLFPDHAKGGGFQEVWYLKLNNSADKRALWLRFTVLIRSDKSKEVAETWAIFFDASSGQTRKVGLKNTYPLDCFDQHEAAGPRIGDTYFLENKTEGTVQDSTNQIRWSMDFRCLSDASHDFVPAMMRSAGLVKNTAVTVFEALRFDGWCEVNGERYVWTDAPGMAGHLSGPRNGHSWAWGHCNCFLDEDGMPALVIWDGLSARAALGKRGAPPLSSMFFQVGDKRFNLNTVRDAFRARSHYDYDGWRFRMCGRGVTFEGHVVSRLADFAGVTYEDTDGALLFCHNAKICDMTLDITGPDGPTRRYRATGTAAYEVVSRTAHPRVPLVI